MIQRICHRAEGENVAGLQLETCDTNDAAGRLRPASFAFCAGCRTCAESSSLVPVSPNQMMKAFPLLRPKVTTSPRLIRVSPLPNWRPIGFRWRALVLRTRRPVAGFRGCGKVPAPIFFCVCLKMQFVGRRVAQKFKVQNVSTYFEGTVQRVWSDENGVTQYRIHYDDGDVLDVTHETLIEILGKDDKSSPKSNAMKEAFEIAHRANDPAATALLKLSIPTDAKLANHNFGSSHTHRWFRGEDNKLYWVHGQTAFYTGETIKKEGDLYAKFLPKGEQTLEERWKAYVQLLKGYSGMESEQLLRKAGIRIFDEEPAFRPVVLAANCWVFYWPEPIQVPAKALIKTTGNSYDDRDLKNLNKTINATIQFVKRMSRGEMKIVMTFPRDWKFSCQFSCGDDEILVQRPPQFRVESVKQDKNTFIFTIVTFADFQKGGGIYVTGYDGDRNLLRDTVGDISNLEIGPFNPGFRYEVPLTVESFDSPVSFEFRGPDSVQSCTWDNGTIVDAPTYLDTGKLLKHYREYDESNDDEQNISRATADSKCFGDAIPPLIAARAGINIWSNHNTMSNPFVVDIFCSCGGMSAGLAMTNSFDSLLAVDMDIEKLKIYGRNFPKAEILYQKLKLPAHDKIDVYNSDPHNVKFKYPKELRRDYDRLIDIIVETAIRRSDPDKQSWRREKWRNERNYTALRLPIIHLHGSPSCRDFSRAAHRTGHDSGSSKTTILWFAGFFRYSQKFKLFSSMSMEEAARQQVIKNNEHREVYAKVDKIMGMKHRLEEKWNRDGVYWMNVDYARAGLPADGKRMFAAWRWDPMALHNNEIASTVRTIHGGSALVRSDLKLVSPMLAIMALPVAERIPRLMELAYNFLQKERSFVGQSTRNSFFMSDLPILSLLGRSTNGTLARSRHMWLKCVSRKGLLTREAMEEWDWWKTSGFGKKRSGYTEHTQTLRHFRKWAGTRSSNYKKKLLFALYGFPDNLPRAMNVSLSRWKDRKSKTIHKKRIAYVKSLLKILLPVSLTRYPETGSDWRKLKRKWRNDQETLTLLNQLDQMIRRPY